MSLIIDNFGQAKENDIKYFENKFNIVIPEDYKNFLLQGNGGKNSAYKHENSIEITQINEKINIDIMFGLKTKIKNADIEQWTSEYQDDIFENSIIIGDTIQHGFIILWISGDGNEGVYYYDDTYELEVSNDDNNAYFLAPSFSEFLDMVEN